MSDTAAVVDVNQSAIDLQTKLNNNKPSKLRKIRGPAQDQILISASQAETLEVIQSDQLGSAKKVIVEQDDAKCVCISKAGRAPQIIVSDDRMTMSGTKGYKTARATHGVFNGCWYYEVKLDFLGKTGHARVGWCTIRGELQASVGFDDQGYCYRDLEGSKVHKGLRQPYGEAFCEGDIIGVFIYMPEGGRPLDFQGKGIARHKGSLFNVEEADPEAKPLLGSKIAFTRNGVLQGVAFSDVSEGTYFPAASVFTLPEQTEPAKLTFNFGPDFTYPPPQVEGCPAAQAISVLNDLGIPPV